MDELKAPGKPFDISKRAVWEAWEKVKANKGAPGDGTQPLTASAPPGDLPLARPRQRAGQYRDTPSPVPRGSRRPGSRRLHAGHHLASKRISARLIPESPKHPGSDVVLEFRHVSNDSLALAFPVPA